MPNFLVCTKCHKHVNPEKEDTISWDIGIEWYRGVIDSERTKEFLRTCGETEFVAKSYHKKFGKYKYGRHKVSLCGPLEEPNDMDEFMEWLNTYIQPIKNID